MHCICLPPTPPHPASLIGLQGPPGLLHSWAQMAGDPQATSDLHHNPRSGPSSRMWTVASRAGHLPTQPQTPTIQPHVQAPTPLKCVGWTGRIWQGQGQAECGQALCPQARRGLNSGRKGLAASEQAGQSVGSWLGAPLQARPQEPRSVPPKAECEQGGSGGEVLQVQRTPRSTPPSPAPPHGGGRSRNAPPHEDSGLRD